MKMNTPRREKPFCSCGAHYMCLEGQWLVDRIEFAETMGDIGLARLFAMILCAHRRIEIKRLNIQVQRERGLPKYGVYLRKENRITNAPTPID